MKLAISIVFVAAAVGIVGVATASARTSYPTKISHDGSVTLPGGQTLDTGHVTSTYRRCSRFRGMKLIGHYPDGGTKLLDIDLTSFGGAWATKADLAGASASRPWQIKETLRIHHRRRVCEPAVVVWALL